MTTLYRTTATATGGRNGQVRTDDGFSSDLALPKALGGSGKSGANPEQLFASGYAACFQSAMEHVARVQKITTGSSEVSATVGIGPNDKGGFALTVALVVIITGIDQAGAETLVAAAHQVCPYSNATRGNIDVQISVRAQ
ncbi:peroxiredoxin, Ohr subfamily [Andreprevotia lacus DSM 23236]|uniref:Peroxiredoxin, Ohr subfamily n=1 Tax=Andreprevotia lacus DSM 23236 TaxID=1121001 RepID=A0A1W1XRD0_9NEIS|nr:organic hydroperoxide resistance protein [Andreprevotia lacus]SMC26071.1 peroxiredoxin, Ohr subfamily [Andreprevotia lacus DSM 23236]